MTKQDGINEKILETFQSISESNRWLLEFSEVVTVGMLDLENRVKAIEADVARWKAIEEEL